MNTGNDIRKVIRQLCETQRYAVLATSDVRQPYTSLMAFAVTSDLRRLILLTERNTQKHANLQSNKSVAVLIDNRENSGTDAKDAIAVTAIGEAEIAEADSSASLLGLYLARHPYLREFAKSPTCAMVSVNVSSYLVVRQFQIVVEWRTEMEGDQNWVQHQT